MKRYSAIIDLGRHGLVATLFSIVFHASALGQLSADRWEEVQKNKQGTIIATYAITPGLAYKDPEGKLTGVCIELMQHFVQYVEKTRKVTLQVKYQERDHFKAFYQEVKNSTGGVFGLGNVTITDGRKKEIHFSAPFMTNITTLLSHPDVPTLTDITKLGTTFRGMTAYTAAGTTNEKTISYWKSKYYPDLKIVQLANSQDVIDKVLATPNSFTNLDFSYYIGALKDKKNVKRHTGIDKANEQFGLIMPLNSDWDRLMNEFLTAGESNFLDSIIYKEILVKHLGAPAVQFLQKVQ